MTSPIFDHQNSRRSVRATHPSPEKTLDTKNVANKNNVEVFKSLFETIKQRRNAPPSDSYVSKLLSGGYKPISAKLKEELAETLEAYSAFFITTDALFSSEASSEEERKEEEHKKKAHLTHEVCDLLFHLLVSCQHVGIELSDITSELQRRTGVSGLQEKANRRKLNRC